MNISPIAGALVASLTLVAAPVSASAAAPSPSLNSKNYSLTQTIENTTNHTLTVTSARVDNGAHFESDVVGQAIAPGASLTAIADNHGNGIQMWIDLVADDGAPLSIDADIPKVNPNSVGSVITVDPMRTDMEIESSGIGGGDRAVATTHFGACMVGDQCKVKSWVDKPLA